MADDQATPERESPEQKYQKLVEKGARLHQMMLSKTDSSTTPDYQLEDLEKWGYAKEPDCKCEFSSCSTCCAYRETIETIESLGLGPASAGVHGGNSVVTHNHWNTYEIDGRRCSPTYGDFCQVINPEHGLLVAYDNNTPESELRSLMNDASPEEISSRLPELRHWSDVAYLQWLSIAGNGSELRWILRNNVINDHTKSAVEQIESIFGMVSENWPGTTHEAGSEAFNVLLATPNGCGIPYLLAQHQKQLGHKTVGRITVFHVPHKGRAKLKILFSIKNVDVAV